MGICEMYERCFLLRGKACGCVAEDQQAGDGHYLRAACREVGKGALHRRSCVDDVVHNGDPLAAQVHAQRVRHAIPGREESCSSRPGKALAVGEGTP